MARGSDGTTALARQLAVLDAFDLDRPFLTLTEIAVAADLTVSTAHRIAAALVAEGLLERREDRTYRLGIRLFELASRTPGALGLREVAMPTMEQAHAIVGHHLQLGVLAGSEVLFVERLSVRQAIINFSEIGGRLPIHVSSAGLVLLAHAPAELADDVLARPLTGFTDSTIISASALRRALSRIRATGFVVTDGHVHPDARGIAVPVRGPDRTVVAALSTIQPNDGSDPSRLIGILQGAAVRIEHDLAALSDPKRRARAATLRTMRDG
jgi:DNA-binding IclR family transcriptional regulator